MRKMVMLCDPEGLPRAWGVAPTIEDARRVANEQLELYRAEKRKVGDSYLANAKYTERVRNVE